jgi:redox-sensitive bicupin YhaK (pirin superfamily)
VDAHADARLPDAQDSMGTSESLGRGAIKFMTAGTGVNHSERNDGGTPLRFIQMCFTPRRSGLPPNYGSYSSETAARSNAWAHLVGDVADAASAAPVKFNADANVHVTELAPGVTTTFELRERRQAYLLSIEGSVRVESVHEAAELAEADAAELRGPSTLRFTSGAQGAHLLLVEMASA